MTHATRFAAVAVLVALAACAPEIDALLCDLIVRVYGA
jgi:hypothetical protein